MKSNVALMFVLFLGGCDFRLCDNAILSKLPSHDGASVAVVFKRSCGATTPEITVVSIFGNSEKIDMGEHPNWLFTSRRKTDVDLIWVNDKVLKITYSTTDKNPTKRDRWRDVLVEYSDLIKSKS